MNHKDEQLQFCIFLDSVAHSSIYTGLKMQQSDCGVSLAPSDFNDISMEDDSTGLDNGGTNVPFEYCQLCLGRRRTFYCVRCVNEGHFTPSGLYQYQNRDNDESSPTIDYRHEW